MFESKAAGELRGKSGAGSVAVLASMIRNLSSDEALAGIAGDSEAGLVDRLRALEELKAAASAAQARVAAALDASVRSTHAAAGVPVEKQGIGVAAQVALARRESPARGGRILGFAKALTKEMPCTLSALSEGRISEWRATLLVRETACLSVADRMLVDREVAGDPAVLEGLGDGRLIALVRKITCRIDQAALVRRAAKAVEDRFVSCRPAPDTMTYLTGLLPVAQGVAVFAALSREADALRARGDGRGRGQIMADTMVERITGQSRADQVPVEVQLVMTDRTLLAGDREPAFLPGYGVVPALWARELVRKAEGTERAGARRKGEGTERAGARRKPKLRGKPGTEASRAVRRDRSGQSGAAGGFASQQAQQDQQAQQAQRAQRAQQAQQGGVWLRRLYTSPSSGELIGMDSTARFVPEGLARLITARDQTCRTPWCDAPIRHMDHIRPYKDGGGTEARNIQGLCEACNHAKEAPGWTAEPLAAVAPHGNQQTEPSASAREAGPPPSARSVREARPPNETGQVRHAVETATPTGHRYVSTAPCLPGTRMRAPN